MDTNQNPDAIAAKKREDNITYLILLFIIGGWAATSAIFGLIGFIMWALALVPVVFIIMVLLTFG